MNKKFKILLVDDEQDILDVIGYNLEQAGYDVITAENGQEAIKIAKKEKPHLVLMDVMMPKMDGIKACEKMRSEPEFRETIIAFLSALQEDFSKLAGFEAGADIYITKPIKPKLLVSQVNALLRRLKNKSEMQTIQLGDIFINYEQYKITYKGEEMVLPRKEFELLSLLTSQPGKVFKRDEILDNVWGNDVIVGGRTIDVHIRKLREKLGDNHFKTIKGVGYKFVE